MKLLKMTLDNFQGIKHLDLVFNGQNKSIHGDNATGKTTIANAQAWLLTGKSSDNQKNYTPKTEGAHGLDHSVECRYETREGVVTLKKILKEKYTKKRGSTTAEFSGHVVEYYKDDVPVKEKEYNEYLAAMFNNSEYIQLLSDVSYFPEVMKWDKRRQLLIDMCGDYSDDYIIASNPELLELKTVLLKDGTNDQYHTVGDFMKMTKERMKKTNAEIQTIPERIDEATRAMPIISEDAEQLKAKLESYNSEIDELTLEMNSIILSNDDENKKNEMIRNIQMQIKEARIDYQNEFSNKRGEFQNQINVISSEINKLNMKFNSIESRISNTEKDIKYESRNADNLRKQFYDYQTEYKEILGNEWDTSKEICPTCGQSLPDNEIEVLKAKFNLDKSNKLEDIKAKIADITQRGITINEGIEQEQALINSLKKEQEKIGTDLVLKKQELNKLEKSKPQIEPFETTETYKIFQSKLKEANELSVQNINDERMDEIEIELKELKTKAEEAQYILNQLSTVEYQKKRITELKETQKALSATYEKMESHIYLCEQFIKAKVNMITENINQKFESVSFKLFETQINGGLKECCEVMIPSPGGVSVTYASANNAAKINAGLEIVETLQRHFNMELPVFIDNAESVTKLRNTATQVIRLVVDENYKELKSMEE